MTKLSDYREIQKKADKSPKYRRAIKRARLIAMERVEKSGGWVNNIDNFLLDHGLWLSMSPKERGETIERMSQISIFDL